MNLKKIALMALVALAAAALAQDGPGGPPPGGFPPPGMGRGGPADNNPLFVLARHDVQEDLKLTDDQITKLDGLRESLLPQGGPGMGGPGAPGGPPPDMGGGPGGPREDFDKRLTESQAAINRILTADQQKRLKEISIQLGGNSAILQDGVQKDLALTPNQKAKAKTLLASQRTANRAVFDKMRNGDIEREQVRTLLEKNSKALDKALGELLTDAQKAKLKQLRGATFKADKAPEPQG